MINVVPIKYVTFNPDDAYALVKDACDMSGIYLPPKLINEVFQYLIENLDMNLAYCSTFWTQVAITRFATNTGTLPSLGGVLSDDQINLVMELLQPLGLTLFGIVHRNHLFKVTDKETFPYVVRSITNGMVVLEEDT